MARKLTSGSTLDGLKREAKRWLRALRAGDEEAKTRFARAHPHPHACDPPTLRDVQLALAREHGLPGWTDLKREVEAIETGVNADPRQDRVQELLEMSGRGDVARVAGILDAHPDLVNAFSTLPGNTGRRTALHLGSGHEPVVRLLLERGADPNIRDDGDNATPLHFAAERGDLAVVRLLVEHGADPIGDGDMHELQVIGWATCFDNVFHPEVAEFLLAHGARHTIFSAVAMGATGAIREIVGEAPAEIERPMDRTNHRRRPLHLAVVKDQPPSLDALLELGADRDAVDAAGLTSLDQAALSGQAAMAERLIEAGARVGLPAAVALGRTADIAALLQEDPHVLRPGGRWGRLIIRAAERSPGHVIDTLIGHGASVHVRDDHRTAVDQTHGYTALHAAAFSGNLEAARALLRHGADPTIREDKYWGTPAGWADHAGHEEVRDLILEGPIDLFDAIAFDRLDRVDGILARNPQALERKIGEYLTGKDRSKPWLDPAWTPVDYARANGKDEAVRKLRKRDAMETVPDRDLRVADFLRRACLDWRVSGGMRAVGARDAARLLEREPWIRLANFYTAVVCGELEEARRLLDEDPERVSRLGGPRGWPPILYLSAARLASGDAAERAPEMLRLLLDRGADPNAYYLGGNADIHYTALTCVLGRGEELASMHPRAREMSALLLERGADPRDNQVLYNVFADNTSRHLLDDGIVWLLDLMYEHSIRRGHAADWKNPLWPMFDMRGAPSLGDDGRVHHGARFMLDAAVDRNLLGMAEWLLERGAGPNAPPGELWRGRPRQTLYQEAMALGHTEMAELLVRYGAERVPLERQGMDAFIDACLRWDRKAVDETLAAHPEYLHDHRPMFAAIKRDRDDVVRMLLDLGASPDVEDEKHGRTRALHIASGSERCARLLIERGAEIDPVETNHGSTPIGWASYFGHTRVLELLAQHSRNIWTLTYQGMVDRVRELVRESPELAKVVSEQGQTPLFWLPGDEGKAVAVVEVLLEHGADPARRDKSGATAAEVAERRGLTGAAAVLRP